MDQYFSRQIIPIAAAESGPFLISGFQQIPTDQKAKPPEGGCAWACIPFNRSLHRHGMRPHTTYRVPFKIVSC